LFATNNGGGFFFILSLDPWDKNNRVGRKRGHGSLFGP
jgi:hypothetical protein